eukprot:IDg1206t1
MVNQKDFKLTVTQRKVARLRRLFRMALQTEQTQVQVRIHRQLRYALNDMGLIMQRSRTVTCSSFNLNAISDEQCLILFRFTKAEIPRIAHLVDWSSAVTSRNGYVCDPLTGTCILLRRLAFPSRWVDLEEMFGMHSSALSEVFYECAWSLYECMENYLLLFELTLL